MRRLSSLAVLLLTAPCALAQQTAPAPVPASAASPSGKVDAAALLELSAGANGLHGSGILPWHLRAHWQTLDDKKQVKEQGAWEEWWAGTRKFKIVARQGDAQETTYGTERGFFVVQTGSTPATSLAGDADSLPSQYFATYPGTLPAASIVLERLFTHPVPEAAPGGSSAMRLQETQPHQGDISLDCVLQAFVLPDGSPHRTMNKDGQLDVSVNRYCWDTESHVLRLESAPGVVTSFSSVVRFQGQYLARSIRIEHTGVRTFTNNDPTLSQTSRSYSVQEADIGVDAVEALATVSEADFTPPANAVQVSDLRTAAIAYGAMPGERIRGDLMKERSEGQVWRLDGSVVVGVKILKDGSVSDLHVVSGPRGLQQDALDIFKSWQFEPYLVGGEPVQVTARFTYSHEM